MNQQAVFWQVHSLVVLLLRTWGEGATVGNNLHLLLWSHGVWSESTVRWCEKITWKRLDGTWGILRYVCPWGLSVALSTNCTKFASIRSVQCTEILRCCNDDIRCIKWSLALGYWQVSAPNLPTVLALASLLIAGWRVLARVHVWSIMCRYIPTS
jgi:hypothetical protein